MAPKYVIKILESWRENPQNSISWNPLVTPAQKLVAYPDYARIGSIAAGKGIVSRDYFPFYFFSLGEQIKIFDRAPLQAQKRNEKWKNKNRIFFTTNKNL